MSGFKHILHFEGCFRYRADLNVKSCKKCAKFVAKKFYRFVIERIKTMLTDARCVVVCAIFESRILTPILNTSFGVDFGLFLRLYRVASRGVLRTGLIEPFSSSLHSAIERSWLTPKSDVWSFTVCTFIGGFNGR